MKYKLPCPYCGSADLGTNHHKVCYSDQYPWTVNCNNLECEAAGPRSRDEDEAVERWNRAPRRDAVDPVPVRMPAEKWAKAATVALMDDAKRAALDRFALALRVIAHLRWWQIGQAPKLAAKALGIFNYWNADWQPDDFTTSKR